MRYGKRLPNGYILYVEEMQRSKGDLAFKTIYMQKSKEGGEFAATWNAKNPPHTSETGHGSSADSSETANATENKLIVSQKDVANNGFFSQVSRGVSYGGTRC